MWLLPDWAWLAQSATPVEESWNNALAGKSGIGVITQFDASSFGSRIAGEVKNFEVEKYLPAKEARRFDRFIQLGIAAAVQALDDSGLTFEGEEAERAGSAIGSGIGGLPIICPELSVLYGKRRTPHLSVPDSRRDCQHGLRTALHHAQFAGSVPGLLHSLHNRPAQHR